jgi:uncharacterized protein (TIGR02466 family)
MMSVNIMGLFPIPLGRINLGRELSFDENNFIVNQHKKPRDDYTALQSRNSKILEDIVLNDLKIFFEKSLNNFFQEVFNPATNVSLRITQSWANYSTIGRSHHKHAHTNSVISGVFYVDTNSSDKIFFCRDTPIVPYTIETKELINMWDANELWVSSEKGTLLLFPSTLEHRVDPVVEEKERISISFNSFFSGEIGNPDNLTQLIV